MSNSERRKIKVEAPPMVSKSRRTQRRPIEARLQGHPLRVNAADLPRRRFLHLAASAAAFPAVSDALADPTVRARLADLGQEIFPRDKQTPEALGAFQKAEIEKWWPIIKAAGIKAE